MWIFSRRGTTWSIICQIYIGRIGCPDIQSSPFAVWDRRQIRHLGNDLGTPCEASNSREAQSDKGWGGNPEWVELDEEMCFNRERTASWNSRNLFFFWSRCSFGDLKFVNDVS